MECDHFQAMLAVTTTIEVLMKIVFSSYHDIMIGMIDGNFQ